MLLLCKVHHQLGRSLGTKKGDQLILLPEYIALKRLPQVMDQAQVDTDST